MSIKAIIFGATGMVGQAVLLECIEDGGVESVLLINRRPLENIKHPKIKEIIYADFSDFSSLLPEFSKYNACFFCLGVSAVGMREEEYYKTTFELTIRAAEAVLKANSSFTFCYVSGSGTDSSEKSKAMWARIKGKTENALMAMPFKATYMFRPGYIQPLKGIKSKVKWYMAVYFVFKPIYFLLKSFKSWITDTTSLGKAMINVVRKGCGKKILESRDINEIAVD